MAALPQCDAFYPLYDQAGAPSENQLVTLEQVIDASGNSILATPLNTFTDLAGAFHFTLPQGASVLIFGRSNTMLEDGQWFSVPKAASAELVPILEAPEAFAVVPPLEFSNNVLSIPNASTTQDGYLSAADFASFSSGGASVGTVTEIATGIGLAGGPITTSGTISIATISGLNPGPYSSPSNISVNSQGQIVSITGGNFLPMTGGTLTGSLTVPNLIVTGNITYQGKVVRAGGTDSAGAGSGYQMLQVPNTGPAAPVISGISSGTPGVTVATITWTTDVQADSQVEYGATSAYGNSTVLDSSLVTSHLQNLSGLTGGQQYHFRVKSSAGGVLATSGDNIFTTATSGSPPTITVGPSVPSGSLTNSSATITWTTSQLCDSQVEWGLTDGTASPPYTNSTPVTDTAPRVTSHSVVLTGLAAGTHYHFHVKSSNATAQSVVSADQTFDTTPGGPTLSTGLVSYWKLDETGTTAPRVDSVAGNNTFTTLSGVTNSTGKIGNGLGMSNTGAYASVPDNTSQNISGPMTITGWILLGDVTPNLYIPSMISKRDSAGSNIGFWLGYNSFNGSWTFGASANGTAEVDCLIAASPIAGTWYFLAAVYDGTSLKLSINGAAFTTIAFAGPIHHSTVALQLCSFGNPASASVDEIGWWSRALSLTEIGQLYNSGAGLAYPFP
jgi:hypothetical protein